MTITRSIVLLCFGLLVTTARMVDAQQEPEKISVERAIQAAERRNGDFGPRGNVNANPFELQTTYRLNGLTYGLRYRYEAGHAEAWLKCMRDEKRSIYARLCAAFYLLDDHEEARKFVVEQMKSPNLRARNNAAWVVDHHVDNDSKKTWGIGLLLGALNDGSLDGRGITSASSHGEPEGDGDDILYTPIDDICSTIGRLKPPDVVPTLIAVLKRRPQTRSAARFLGRIGDESAIPILMEILVNRTGDEDAVVDALATFKHKEAVPVLIARLRSLQRDDSSRATAMLDAFLKIGDQRAIEPIEKYLAGDHSEESKAVARRVLVQLRSPDPVKELIELLDRETEWVARGDLIDALAEYHDQRVVTKLADMARTSGSASERQDAINGLTKLGDRSSMLALTSLLDHPFPANLKEEWALKGRSEIDWRKRLPEIVHQNLKYNTKQDFGRDRKKWEEWITKNVIDKVPAAEKR